MTRHRVTAVLAALLEAALVAALAVWGVRLFRAAAEGVRAARAVPTVPRTPIGEWFSPEGIQPDGRVAAVPPERLNVVFLIREVSARADVAFWRKVAARLPAGSGIGLVAYCAGGHSAVGRTMLDAGRWPGVVFSHGPLADIQALLGADSRGEFLLLDSRFFIIGVRRWRGPRLQPAAVVREIAR